MDRITHWTARLLVLPLLLALCGAPEIAQAQTDSNQASGNTPAQAPENGAPAQNPGMVDPSKGPLQPIPPADNPPENPSPQPSAQSPTSPEPAQPLPRGQQPAGTAVGERGTTAGGAASRPAGSAIAPAKQHQYRSLFIKIGVIAAAGAAIGTVVALTKGSPSKPPGAP